MSQITMKISSYFEGLERGFSEVVYGGFWVFIFGGFFEISLRSCTMHWLCSGGYLPSFFRTFYWASTPLFFSTSRLGVRLEEGGGGRVGGHDGRGRLGLDSDGHSLDGGGMMRK